MRIGMVLETPFPPDIRVEKEIRALEREGHQVSLLCTRKADQPFEETLGNTNVVRFDPSQRDPLKRKLDILKYWRTFRSPSWEQAIDDFVFRNEIQALHVHDLPLALTGLAVARRRGIPLVFDMHEIYPVMIREQIAQPAPPGKGFNTWLHRSLFSPQWWERAEQRAVQQADRVIVVVDESKHRLERQGIDSKKIFVVLNAEDVDRFTAVGSASQELTPHDYFLAGYVGGVDNTNRGLDNLIRSWPLVLRQIPGARLMIVGDGGLRPSIESVVRELDLTDSVSFTGQVPFDQVAGYIRSFDVAVIPHVINEHTNNTIPHKLFQYLALGKLVVASDIAPIRRILEDTEGGVVVKEWSPEGFAQAFVAANAMLQSGRHDPWREVSLLKEKYGFEALARPLLEMYRALDEAR